MLKIFSFKLIVVQLFGLILLLIGAKRLMVAYYSDAYSSIKDGDTETVTVDVIQNIIFSEIYVSLSVFVFGIIFIGYFNWKNKVSVFNTLIVLISFWIMNFFGLFSFDLLIGTINTIFGLLSDSIFYLFLMSGLLFFFAGIFILFRSTNFIKS